MRQSYTFILFRLLFFYLLFIRILFNYDCYNPMNSSYCGYMLSQKSLFAESLSWIWLSKSQTKQMIFFAAFGEVCKIQNIRYRMNKTEIRQTQRTTKVKYYV